MRHAPSRLAIAVTAAAATLTGVWTAPVAEAAALPRATTFSGQSQVGPLFRQGLNHDHSCVATVITSRTRNVLITAAHCISGTGAGIVFAPGYHAGRAPYGTWTVIHAYVDPMWKAHRNPAYDYALLVVAPQRGTGRAIQSVTGGYALGLAQPTGTRTTITAYRSGRGDSPVHCTTAITRTAGYPTFSCHGYPGGTSGAPFLVGRYVTGVIGGLHQGGCVEYTSYSSPFAVKVLNGLYARAVAGAAPSMVPTAGSDGC